MKTDQSAFKGDRLRFAYVDRELFESGDRRFGRVRSPSKSIHASHQIVRKIYAFWEN